MKAIDDGIDGIFFDRTGNLDQRSGPEIAQLVFVRRLNNVAAFLLELVV